MSVGNNMTKATLDQQCGQLMVTLRDTLQALQNLNDDLLTIGGAQNLETALEYQAADATTTIATLGNMAQLNQIWLGNAAPPAFNYRADTIPFWGGQ